MAAYVKQGDNIVLMFSKAEATALRDLANYADDATAGEPRNGSTAAAQSRAVRAINVATSNTARSGAAID